VPVRGTFLPTKEKKERFEHDGSPLGTGRLERFEKNGGGTDA